jgi:hypothetical protein
MQVGNRQEAENRVLCDDEQVTLQVGSKKFQALVGNLRKLPKLLSTTFPETPIQMPANGVFKIERFLNFFFFFFFFFKFFFSNFHRDPAVFGAVVELLESNSMPSSVSEEKLAEELAFFGCNLDDLELLEDESCDTESDSPQKQVPSNVRVAVDSAPMDQRLLATYSMRADEMFGRAVALVRQEDTIVKITDIQHGKKEINFFFFFLKFFLTKQKKKKRTCIAP